MHHHHYSQQSLSYPAFLILASVLVEPKTVTALCQDFAQAAGQIIEPAAFARVVAGLERHGWIAGEAGAERLRLYHLTASGLLALQQAAAHYRRDQQEQEWNPGLPGGKEIIMRLVLWILRLYPPAWRERYETEMAALLEQHQITLWTVLDLLVGALDARLDPHYRRARQLLPLQRFRTSWRLVIAAFVVFWIALLPWFWISVLGIGPDARCANWGTGYALCLMRVTVGMHTASLPNTLLGFIVGWLVKSPGKQQAQQATLQPYRAIYALLWAALLSLPALISTLQVAMYTIPDVSLSPAVKLVHLLAFLIPTVIIGVITVLIIQLHHRRPRLGRALKDWGIFLLSLLYVMVFPRFETMPPGVSFMGPPFILVCLVIAICIIPALIVRRYHMHRQAARTAQQVENEVSPWVWIISLPIVFLLFCTEVEFIGLPDYNNFGDVLVIWCMAGLASLIILLALKIGSRKSTHSLPEETLQQVQVQR